jgi:GNAT superfamily N-acetyltransferase
MGVRLARSGDWPAIRQLLDQLDYPGTDGYLQERIQTLLAHPDERLLVYEQDATILGVMSLHFIPQLGVKGEFARISYFSIREEARSRGIGQSMEEFATNLARERGCHLIEVHCHERRTRAQGFYSRLGYKESPKYLIKKL